MFNGIRRVDNRVATAAIRMARQEQFKRRLDVADSYWNRFFLPRICVFIAAHPTVGTPRLAR